MQKFNPNKINQNDKDYIEKVSDNWQEYLSQWFLDYKNRILEKQDIIDVIEKIIEYKVNKV